MPKTPEDYEDGVQGMMDDKDNPYEELVPLAQRRITGVKLRSGDGMDEAELALKYGYSMPITELSRSTKKLYGYIRDANLTDPLERNALRGANALNDLIMTAPCLNREKRREEEERLAAHWQAEMDRAAGVLDGDKAEDAGKDDEAAEDDESEDPKPDIDKLLRRWSRADAFMLQARIVEELQGLEAAEKYYPRFIEMKEQQDEVLMEAAGLPPSEYQLFWCRVRQYKIMRERAYDLAMGHPVHDFTDLHKALADGADVNDHVAGMAWTWLVGYQLVIGSVSDGKAHRDTIIALNAQDIPRQPMSPPWGSWPGMPGYMNGHEEEDDDEDEKKDKRGALFGLFGGGGQKNEQPKTLKRRQRGRR